MTSKITICFSSHVGEAELTFWLPVNCEKGTCCAPGLSEKGEAHSELFSTRSGLDHTGLGYVLHLITQYNETLPCAKEDPTLWMVSGFLV